MNDELRPRLRLAMRRLVRSAALDFYGSGSHTDAVRGITMPARMRFEEELAAMQDLVRAAMREGALGVGSSLIYAPAAYADTAELIDDLVVDPGSTRD